jgi:hypothetical protein
MPTVKGMILSLVIAPVDQRDPAFSAFVEELLAELEASSQVAQPVPERAPGGVSWPPPGLNLDDRGWRKPGTPRLTPAGGSHVASDISGSTSE